MDHGRGGVRAVWRAGGVAWTMRAGGRAGGVACGRCGESAVWRARGAASAPARRSRGMHAASQRPAAPGAPPRPRRSAMSPPHATRPPRARGAWHTARLRRAMGPRRAAARRLRRFRAVAAAARAERRGRGRRRGWRRGRRALCGSGRRWRRP
eukprot:650718-Prymnesium_polylepis.1